MMSNRITVIHASVNSLNHPAVTLARPGSLEVPAHTGDAGLGSITLPQQAQSTEQVWEHIFQSNDLIGGRSGFK